jgi:hypothetical protein
MRGVLEQRTKRVMERRNWERRPAHNAVATGDGGLSFTIKSAATGRHQLSGIDPGYRKEGSRRTPTRIPLYSY